jgi:hypothetical protein
MPKVVELVTTAAAVYTGQWWIIPVVSTATQTYGNIQQRRKARQAAQAQRDAYNASLSDRTVSIVSADNPWQVVYGEATVAPAFVAILTSGDRDQYKHVVAVWAAHECEAITDTFLAGVSVGALDGDGYVTGGKWSRVSTDTPSETKTVVSGTLTMDHPVASFLGASWTLTPDDRPTELLNPTQVTVAGNVITLDSSLWATWEGRVLDVTYDWTANTALLRVRHHLGSDSQTADAALLAELPSEWTSNDRGRGLCYSVFTYNLNEPEFQNGPLQPTARVKGRKVYDPRLDSTQPGGSGSHRRDDPSTWAWSRNPELCTTDFVRAPFGKRASSAQVQWDAVMAGANVCATGVDYGSGSEPLYTCDGAFRTDEDPDVTLDQLCQSMAGFATFNGTWLIQPGSYTAPVLDLTDADNAGPIDVTPGLGVGEVINGLRGRFYDPTRFDQITDYPPYSNAAFVAEDGQAWFDNLNLPFTASAARAHQLARVQVERSRGMQMQYPAKMRAVRLRPGQRVRVTNSLLNLTAAVFRVMTREYSVGGRVNLGLAQDGASMYDMVDAPAPLSVPTVGTVDPFRPAPVVNLAVLSDSTVVVRDTDGTVITRVTVTYDASGDVLVRTHGALQIEYRVDSATEWQRAPPAPGDSTSTQLLAIKDERLYVVRARWQNALGAVSDWRSTAVETNAAPTAGIDLKLSAESLVLTADATGFVSSYTGATINVRVERGGVDDTAAWSLAVSFSTGIAGGLDGNQVQVTDMTVDAGSGTVTATRAGFPAQAKNFTLVKVRSAGSSSGAVSNAVFSAYATGTATATGGIRFNPDGTVSRRSGTSGSYVAAGNWHAPTTAGIGSTHWVRAVVRSGSTAPMSGTVGSWLQLSTARTWSNTASSPGDDESSDLDYEIATSAGGTPVVATGGVISVRASV